MEIQIGKPISSQLSKFIEAQNDINLMRKLVNKFPSINRVDIRQLLWGMKNVQEHHVDLIVEASRLATQNATKQNLKIKK